jgi:hypothetical protein
MARSATQTASLTIAMSDPHGKLTQLPMLKEVPKPEYLLQWSHR